MSDPTLRARLRRETAALHEAVEQAVGILDPALSRGHYVAILCAFYGFYLPIERLVPAYASPSPSLDLAAADRRKVPLLVSDLSALGIGVESQRSIPVCVRLPDLSAHHRRLGCMYVLEGATLGGQAVLPHLAASLGVRPNEGARFFNSYGDAVGTRWRAFLAEMEAAGTDQASRDQIVGGAVDTFSALLDWFGQSSARSDPCERQAGSREDSSSTWPLG